MKNHVTVVPADRLIIVDGLDLHLDFTAPDNLHALQWHDGTGELEKTDGTPNTILTSEADYVVQVAPFVALWEAEDARLKAEAEAVKAAAEAEYNLPKNVLQRQIDAVDTQLAALDTKYLTPRVLAGMAVQDAYALSQWNAHETDAAPLRAQRAELVASLENI